MVDNDIIGGTGAIDDGLRQQLRYLATLSFYRDRSAAAGVDLERVGTWEEFRKLPLLTRQEFEACFEKDSTWGGFGVPGVVRMNFTTSGGIGLLPEFNTRPDLAVSAKALAQLARSAGITDQDLVQITLGYHILVAGRLFDEGFAELGACAIQAGAVSTDQQLAIAKRAKPNVLMSNPSFAKKLGQAGLRGIHRMILTGEPFTAIEGRREALKEAFGGELLSAVDTYGVSECFPVAAECSAENGMHLMEEFCVTEVLDPETGEPVGPGCTGELVVSHRNKQAMPFLRYRTGDLAIVERSDCPCGATWVLPRGVFGRTDNMSKVKGVKFYPGQVAFVLAGFTAVDPRRYRVTIRLRGGVDNLELEMVGDSTQVDYDAIGHRLKEATLISFDKISAVAELAEGPVVRDLRRADAVADGTSTPQQQGAGQ